MSELFQIDGHFPAVQDLPRLAESEVFDLILLDLHIPASAASEGLHPFQRRWPDTPLILSRCR